MVRQFWRIFLFSPLSVHIPSQGFEASVKCTPVNERVFYTVKPGECLADILLVFDMDTPLWDPKRGYVYKVSKLNQLQDPNLIHPGDVIDLPFACEEMLARFEVKQTSSGREVHQKPNRVTASEEMTETSTSLAPVAQAQNQIEQVQNFKTFSRLSAAGIYNFYRIDSKSSSSNSTAILLSEPSLGINLSWQQAWTEKFATRFYLSQSTVRMRDASSGTLLNGSKSLGEIGFELDYAITPNLTAKVDSGYGNHLLARAISAGSATLDSVYASRLGVAVVPTLIRKGDLSVDLQLGYFQIFPTSTNDYSLKTGEGFTLAPGLRHKLKKMQMELDLKYEDLRQSSSISNQKNKQVGIYFGLSFEVGK